MTILAFLAAVTVATGESPSGQMMPPNEPASTEKCAVEPSESRKVKSCSRIKTVEGLPADLQRISISDRTILCWTSE